MASGIPFVPLDCQLDEKFDYIEAEFGLIGFAIVVKLFQRIYGGHGYYCEWNDRVALLFAHKNGVGADVVREIVSAAIREDIFSRKMYEDFGILTSAGVQKRFAEVAKRRKEIFDKTEYVMLRCAQISENADNSGQNVCNSGQNVCNSATSKVKESKVNVSEVKESNAAPPPASPATRTTLVAEYGEKNVKHYEERFRKWSANKGKKFGKNIYPIIADWMKNDGIAPPSSNSSLLELAEKRGIRRYNG